MSAHTLAELALALLEGVEVIHQSGYLHRDIKPGNIFLRQDNAPVLLDFGSARTASVDTERTAIVSPGYAPLEQYHSHGNQGPWTDIYALGAVLYWLVTGHKPMEATARVPHDAMPPVARVGDAAAYPLALLESIDWALAPAERSRPQTVAAWRQSLAGLVDPQATSTHSTMVGATSLADTTVVQTRTSQAPAFDAAKLQQIAADLAVHLGPVASIVVKSAARKSTTSRQLVEGLANDIADATVRADFIKKHAPATDRSQLPTTERSQPTRTDALPTGLYPPPPTFDAALLARAESELAQHIGAVAKAIVRRAAAKARGEQELYNLLANEIDDVQGRKVFLRRVMSVSGRV